jgi:hypothetical protein
MIVKGELVDALRRRVLYVSLSFNFLNPSCVVSQWFHFDCRNSNLPLRFALLYESTEKLKDQSLLSVLVRPFSFKVILNF